MTGSGSPCGACKFLRRRCARGCVFAPYFSHEQGASNFAAVHKVFGASNAAKLLAHLPLPHGHEAALTISYEAQARLHDPVYGCVSHIFALQHQVVNLQAQLVSLKEQAGQSYATNNSMTINSAPTLANPTDDDHHRRRRGLESWLDQYPCGVPLHHYYGSSSCTNSIDYNINSEGHNVSNSVPFYMDIAAEQNCQWPSTAAFYDHQDEADF